MKSISVVVFFFTVMLSGCGTVLNLHDFDLSQSAIGDVSIFRPDGDPPPKHIYGGVKWDAMAGIGWFQESTLEPPLALLGLYVWFVDLPISAVADTITLPVTIPASIDRAVQEYYFPEKATPIAETETANYH